MKTIAACCLVLALVAPALADRYSWTHTDGLFKVDALSFQTPFGLPYGPGMTVGVVIEGETTDVVTAGTLKFNLWEDDVSKFEDNGNLAYFKCNNKGCDSSEPVCLYLDDPSAAQTRFQIRFDFVMTRAEKSGDFRLVVFGQDQHHYPYDFSVTVNYNYTFDAAAAVPALPAPAKSLRGSNAAPVAVPAPMGGAYQYNTTNGNFVVDTLTMTGTGNDWTAGSVVNVTLTGSIQKFHVLAGTVKYKVYEFGAQHFVSSGNFPYFECTNKGCDPTSPVALTLQYPTAVPTKFTASVKIVLPAMQTGASNPFILEVWGVDQDHQPLDFVASIRYALAPTPPKPSPMFKLLAPPAPAASSYDYNVTDGSFKVDTLTMTSASGKWLPGSVVNVTMTGTIADFHVLAGTVKYKVYEFGAQHFVSQGNFPYFECDNKGCDPTSPVALTLQYPTAVPTKFTASVKIVLPAMQTGASNPFILEVWGVDQTHAIDFLASIRYALE